MIPESLRYSTIIRDMWRPLVRHHRDVHHAGDRKAYNRTIAERLVQIEPRKMASAIQ
jgi:hypothetical protein